MGGTLNAVPHQKGHMATTKRGKVRLKMCPNVLIFIKTFGYIFKFQIFRNVWDRLK